MQGENFDSHAKKSSDSPSEQEFRLACKEFPQRCRRGATRAPVRPAESRRSAITGSWGPIGPAAAGPAPGRGRRPGLAAVRAVFSGALPYDGGPWDRRGPAVSQAGRHHPRPPTAPSPRRHLHENRKRPLLQVMQAGLHTAKGQARGLLGRPGAGGRRAADVRPRRGRSGPGRGAGPAAAAAARSAAGRAGEEAAGPVIQVPSGKDKTKRRGGGGRGGGFKLGRGRAGKVRVSSPARRAAKADPPSPPPPPPPRALPSPGPGSRACPPSPASCRRD